ncbi:MAG TPA: non-homologous end-joining DNA ligase [Acidimicrobiales bacterium]
MTTFPSGLLPMKAVNGTQLPEDDGGWAFEIKWDGMRLLAYVDPGAATPLCLQTTRGHDAAPRYPELAGLADAVGRPAVLDGEVVVLDENGRSDFGRLQRHEDAVTFIVFDLLWLDGHDVTALPYLDRRRLLADLVEDGEGWLIPSHLVGDGAVLLEQARVNGLEGLVAKRVDSPYTSGKRSPAWRKVKIRRAQEFVVGGWLPGEGNRTGSLGALLVGHHDDGGLRYAGRVGTGFNGAELRRLQPRLDERAIDTSPFVDELPAPARRQARFVRPELVVQVEFAEWTSDGRLRHPAYLHEREDKDPADVVREP